MPAVPSLDKLAELYEESMALANECSDGFGDEAMVLKQLVQKAASAVGHDQLELLILALNVHGTSENSRMAGKIAQRQGFPRNSCPYPNETVAMRLLANSWLEGWECSRRESEDATMLSSRSESSEKAPRQESASARGW